MPTVSETLRKVLRDRGEGVREIARAAGIDPTRLSRFLHGGELRSKNLDALAAFCGLVLTPKPGRARKGK